MKKEDYEKLGELERVIYDHLSAAFVENRYTISLESGCFASDGYLDAKIIICGIEVRCAINERGFICFHCGEHLEKVFGLIPHFVRKIVAQTKRMIRENEPKLRQQRINELEEELKKLKAK